ncbi:FxLD family lanthipeptide [Micromonospora sp. DH14]|uniref:FxLD family lanthipeptide n=1 Tax=Micromonospora sp. DH14 TaxID=3040120 RepID=UPI00244117D1|nr:FxLD family lanthipeptide [Micromonospora sp. DH14]MDG9674672.1 FxLD family lanthipeptide [Micromonospora sp. DH14]
MEFDEYEVSPDFVEGELNLRLVDAGPALSAYATATDDGCGSGNTGSNACSGGGK